MGLFGLVQRPQDLGLGQAIGLSIANRIACSVVDGRVGQAI